MSPTIRPIREDSSPRDTAAGTVRGCGRPCALLGQQTVDRMGTTCATTVSALCIRSGELWGSLMPSDRESATTVAQLAPAEATARRVMDVVAESFDPLAAVAGASEDGPGRWTVAIHFRDPPSEAAVRALIALAAGADAANGLAFATTTPQDWIKASHEGLRPIEAGRFVVHTAHYRTRLPPNRNPIGIEAP